jgi:hypothetical protein
VSFLTVRAPFLEVETEFIKFYCFTCSYTSAKTLVNQLLKLLTYSTELSVTDFRKSQTFGTKWEDELKNKNEAEGYS